MFDPPSVSDEYHIVLAELNKLDIPQSPIASCQDKILFCKWEAVRRLSGSGRRQNHDLLLYRELHGSRQRVRYRRGRSERAFLPRSAQSSL